VIGQNENTYAIAMMCRVLEVSRAGYYAYRARPTSDRELENRLLLQQIQVTQKVTRQSYGSPRMTRELRTQGNTCGRHRVARLMRENERTIAEIVEAVMAPDINALESMLIRQGYTARALTELLNVRLAEVRALLHGQLPDERADELKQQLLRTGIPL